MVVLIWMGSRLESARWYKRRFFDEEEALDFIRANATHIWGINYATIRFGNAALLTDSEIIKLVSG